ncbi:MAG: hypothetical protein ACTSRP_14460 [Candidatus Helarchaeota archaeon]
MNMKNIENIKEKMKNLKDIIMDNFILCLMIIGIWLTLMGLFVFVKIYVANLSPNVIIITPFQQKIWDLITGGVQFILTLVYIFGGLYVWYRVIRLYFWRRMKKSGQYENEEDDIIIKDD